MNSDSSPQHEWRTYQWVSSDTFAATPFYRAGWEVLRRDLLVFVWKLIADAIGRFAPLVLGLFVVGLFFIDLQLFVAGGYPPFDWGQRFVDLVRSPGFIAGITGAFFVLVLLTTAIEAVVLGGIWGTLKSGLADEPVSMIETFVREAIDWFPDVFALALLRFAVATVTTMFGLALVIGTVHAATVGALTGLENWQLTLFFAASVTFYAAWAGLTRLVLEVAAAPLILDAVPLGESLLRAAAFVLDNFWSLYRLIIFALGVLLVPLAVYWMLAMLNNLALVWPAFETIGALLRLSGEILVFVSASIIGVLFYGALFAFYYHDDTQVPDDPVGEFPFDDSQLDDEDDSDSFRDDAAPEDFIPDETPHRFSFDELSSADDSDDAADESSIEAQNRTDDDGVNGE